MQKFLICVMLSVLLSFGVHAKEYSNKDVAPCVSDKSLLCDLAGQPVTGDVSASFPKANLFVKTQMKDGKPNGTMKEYYSNGNLKGQMTWTDGVPNGPVTTYYEDGTIETIGSYKNGKKDGLSKKYYKDGVVSEMVFEDDQPQVHKLYYPNGQLKSEVPIVNGLPNGVAKTYDENGKLISIQEYKDGEPVQ